MRKPVRSDDHNRRVVIIEVKRSRDFDDLEADCERGIRQIRENNCACCISGEGTLSLLWHRIKISEMMRDFSGMIGM